MKATIVVTTANEPELAARCIHSIIDNHIDNLEILVVAPDNETQKVCEELTVQFLKDEGLGKVHAMNKALTEVKTDIILWTDGDCTVENILPLIKSFENETIGVAGGRVAPRESRGTKWGFFHHFLTEAAHQARTKRAANDEFMELSAYLWGFKKELVSEVPEEAAEDSIIPLAIFKKGYKIAYVPESIVRTKGPEGLNDWVKQKARTIKSHEYLKKVREPLMKTFKNEVAEGTKFALLYKTTSVNEKWWLLQLFPLRLYVWIKSKTMRPYKDKWATSKSTKE
jgi:cellulose synthase/poly-beta-1,6-N-acetylglucosamine synthase-like glycosyltransferase